MPRKLEASSQNKRKQIVIDAHNVSARLGGLLILDDLTFSVRKGEYVGIIGPNGGGKTTLLHVLLGLTKPVSGSVRLFDKSISEFREWGRIGYVPQRVAVQAGNAFPATVREIVATGRLPRLRMFQRFHKKDRAAIDDAINVVGISHIQHRVIGGLSGGECQRVFIARALAGDPDILILDEPTVGVDASSQEAFFSFIRKLNCERGMTVLFVTHDMNVVTSEASTVLCLNHKMECYGSSSDFKKKKHTHDAYGSEHIHYEGHAE